MRLATVKLRGAKRVVTPALDGFIDVNRARSLFLERHGAYDPCARADREVPSSIVDLLTIGGGALASAGEAVGWAESQDREALRAEGAWVPEDEARFLPVIPDAPKFLCVGRNYLEHARESGKVKNEVPILFARFPASLLGHREPMVRPVASPQLDWEVELAVVIGRHCRHVPAERALDVVAGYSVFNDGSVRDYQLRGVQWTAGKNFWHTGPFGPYLVTADEIPDPQALRISTRVNGDLVQDANTAEMIYDVRTLIAHITEWQPLAPGDVIATGTCAGVGLARQPQWWLKPGDVLTTTIEGIGELVNPVIDEASLAPGDIDGGAWTSS